MAEAAVRKQKMLRIHVRIESGTEKRAHFLSARHNQKWLHWQTTYCKFEFVKLIRSWEWSVIFLKLILRIVFCQISARVFPTFGARHAGTSTRWVVTRGWCPSMAIVRPDSCVMASWPPSVAWIHGKIKKIFGQPWGLYGTIYYVW